jgi:tyrosine-protein kinase Etk/Wzc
VKVKKMTNNNCVSSQFEAAIAEPNAERSDERSFVRMLIEVMTGLALRKRFIVTVTGVSTLIGVIVSYALPVQYKAITTVMPPKQTQSTTAFLNSQMGGSMAEMAGGGLLKDPNAIYLGLLKSRPVADALINTFGLAAVYHANDMTAARKVLAANTSIKSEPSTLISISVMDRNKTRAADIANAYVDQLRSLTKNISVTEATRRRLFFEKELQVQNKSLGDAENAFQQVQLNKGLVHLDAQTSSLIGSLGALRSQIATKEIDLEVSKSYSTERNPEIEMAERKLAAMKEEADQLEQHSGPTAYSSMGLKDVPIAETAYVHAARELQYQQSLFDMLLRQYEAAKLDEAKEAANIQVVELAIPPDRKSAPQRAEIVLLFMVLGAAVAWLYIYLTTITDREPEARRTLEEFRAALIGR